MANSASDRNSASPHSPSPSSGAITSPATMPPTLPPISTARGLNRSDSTPASQMPSARNRIAPSCTISTSSRAKPMAVVACPSAKAVEI